MAESPESIPAEKIIIAASALIKAQNGANEIAMAAPSVRANEIRSLMSFFIVLRCLVSR